MKRFFAPSSADVTTFTAHLGEFLRAGILLPDALHLLSAGGKTLPSRLANSILASLQQGQPLKVALRKHSNCFDELYIHMADAGFRSGRLGEFLEMLVDYRSAREKTRQQIIRAISYPMLVFSLSVIIAVALLLQIVPRFEHLFISAGDNLPYVTHIVLQASAFLTNHGLYILFVFLMLFLFFRVMAAFGWWKLFCQSLVLAIPGLAGWKKLRIKEEYLRGLAAMLFAHVPLIEANTIAARACTWKGYSSRLQQVSDNLARGQLLNYAWSDIGLFHESDLLAAKLGSKGVNLGKLLQVRADYYQSILTHKLNIFIHLLEPCLMIFIGLVIGIMVLAVYLPLFSLGQVL